MDYVGHRLKTTTQAVFRLGLLGSRLGDQTVPRSWSKCDDDVLSCHNTTAVDSCCLSYPGGQFLQTQFWDADPAVGPADSWTIHGLWPDTCNGGYEAYCDTEREYHNITAILTQSDDAAGELLPYMQEYWKAAHGDDENLWSHEWSKHGTCISTLDVKCYDDKNYRAQQEVVDYFSATIELFKDRPTYQLLAAAGILPSDVRTWTREEILMPLVTAHGGEDVALRCHGHVLSEIWYYFSALGPVQHGKFVSSDTGVAKNNCPRTGIRYLSKKNPSEIPTSTPKDPIVSPTSKPIPSTPFSGRGSLQVHLKNDAKPTGCLISEGWWYTSGTCATFHAEVDVLNDKSEDDNDDDINDEDEPYMFTLTSSKGHCGFRQNKDFHCARQLPYQTIFSDGATRANSTLHYHNSASFYAPKLPGRFEKVQIFADPSDAAGKGEAFVEVEIVWKSMGGSSYN